ncbi:hypothetical protein [Poseidonocella sp. HB161398]|uniref:hypothetical protein n=1 Tax=Poseidonocella sp. HB161398 TaxID=2320855 RepID=UPI0011086F74|nr:hypothetical protein [Poseidonocella sp. HB161398]
MADTHPLLRLLEAWGAPSSAERYRIVSEVTSEDFYYADPHSGPLTDRAAFVGFLTTFRTRLPDGRIEPAGPVDQHGPHARLPFTLLRGDGPVRQGLYVADLGSDGTVTRLVGFLE